MGAPPDVHVDYDHGWVEVDLRATPQQWAGPAAQQAWTASGRDHGHSDVGRLAGIFAALAESLVPFSPIGAFLLVPEPWAGVSAVVKMTALDTGEPRTLEELLGSLGYPPEALAEPPLTARLDTGAGPAAALRQRVVDPSSAERKVAESLQFVWTFPDRAAALVLGTAFTDLVAADRWRPWLQALAAAVTLTGESDRPVTGSTPTGG
jgi:hypothetical protein